MSLTARAVLADCHLAHEMMESETNHDVLRVQWIGALALLRLVGDVLNKVDARTYVQLASPIKAQYEQDKSDPIYRCFIKGARDRAVHEYSHDLLDRSEVSVLVELSEGQLEVHDLDDCLFMPLIGEFRPGEDARDVYGEALEWWDRHISMIERSL